MQFGVVFLFLANLPLPVDADTSFASDADPFLGRAVATRPIIHAELDSALRNGRRGDVEGRISRLEEQLRPTFESLPKSDDARLESTVVRYLLHRHFLRRHAWLVSGLAPNGGAWNATAPDAILEGHVPFRVQQLVRETLNKRGFTLHETAVLAALLENVVHDDAVNRLHIAWQECGLRLQGKVGIKDMRTALDRYMLGLLGLVTEGKNTKALVKQALEIYPTWKSTQSFVRQLVWKKMFNSRGDISLPDAEHIVVDVSEKYGMWQAGECRDLKNELLAMVGPRPGRVDLRAFYTSAVVDGKWQFTESIPYMLSSGVLDGSKPGSTDVMIPNYINSPSQYTFSSHFYAVSCLDECEPIMGYIERTVAAPYATVEQLEKLVSTPPQDDGLPPFALRTSVMRRRLEDVAAHHGGQIPLHGRLFQQWLHHMYPVQCSYPHVSDSTKLELPEVFQARTGLSPFEPKEAMQNFVKGWPEKAGYVVGDVDTLWDPREELLTRPPESALSVGAALFSITGLAPFHLGGMAGLTGVFVTVVAKMFMWGVMPHTASVALLQVDA